MTEFLMHSAQTTAEKQLRQMKIYCIINNATTIVVGFFALHGIRDAVYAYMNR